MTLHSNTLHTLQCVHLSDKDLKRTCLNFQIGWRDLSFFIHYFLSHSHTNVGLALALSLAFQHCVDKLARTALGWEGGDLPTSPRMPCSAGSGFSSYFSSVKFLSILSDVYSIAIDQAAVCIVLAVWPSPEGGDRTVCELRPAAGVLLSSGCSSLAHRCSTAAGKINHAWRRTLLHASHLY